ncbi:hypothetical protein DXV75_06755 [Alteromonas aestuariivivens]|uniref:Uncharacterized protein n=1 Tax=Alteromonas aestuariivivens TaxID=1938339 RepID=A0A3D8M9Q1_9ALTE|nr:hypothetical protein [Alteromonas aestuariivivens]RDV26681.1 hypothetical protein DXV75_06755 [Alteromonas aestuariivivens]
MWREFESPELNLLMQELEGQNYSPEDSRLRILRAQLLLRQSKSANLPFVSVRVSGCSNRDAIRAAVDVYRAAGGRPVTQNESLL